MSLDAFDADVLIFAVSPNHQHRKVLLGLFERAARDGAMAGVGSVMLLPEILSKPLRDDSADQIDDLGQLLAHLDLRPVDAHVARLAVVLAATYRLKAADAVHLATAVNAGAGRFITNNKKDFRKSIAEIDITYPDDLLADEAT